METSTKNGAKELSSPLDYIPFPSLCSFPQMIPTFNPILSAKEFLVSIVSAFILNLKEHDCRNNWQRNLDATSKEKTKTCSQSSFMSLVREPFAVMAFFF